jgi:hypothetical protein
LQALVLDLETGILEREVLGFGGVLDSFFAWRGSGRGVDEVT